MNDGFLDAHGLGWRWILWFIAGSALLLRLWGTWYGLPFSYWVDEYHEVMRALELGAGGFNLDRTTKGGFYYLLFFEYGLYFILLKFTGVVATTKEFAELFVRDPSVFYLMGRVTAALIGTVTVVVVFRVARRAYSTTAGLLAALFLAINLLHTDLSRMIGVDVPMAMLASLALYFGLRVAERGHKSDYLLAAFCASLAATTKLPGILVVLPLLVAHTYGVAKSGNGLREWLGTRELWLAAGIFAAVLIATNPGILLESGYLSLFSEPSSEVIDEAAFDTGTDLNSGIRPNLFAYYFDALNASMGWPLFGLALVSAAYALWKRTTADVMLLSYGLVNYVLISSTTSDKLYYPRYALPVVIVLTILAGRALADLTHVIARQRFAKSAIITAGLIAFPVSQALVTAYALNQTDTRTLAKNWIDANVAAGSRVLIEGLKIAPIKGTVQLHETPEEIKRRIEYWKVKEPKQAKFLELQLSVHEGGGYSLELMQRKSVSTLDEYLAQGIEYFIVRPDYLVESRRSVVGGVRLVSDLRSDARVIFVKRFVGESKTRFGPSIEIYGLVAQPP